MVFGFFSRKPAQPQATVEPIPAGPVDSAASNSHQLHTPSPSTDSCVAPPGTLLVISQSEQNTDKTQRPATTSVDLPHEIQRLIFEMAVRSHRGAGFNLIQVAHYVYTWFVATHQRCPQGCLLNSSLDRTNSLRAHRNSQLQRCSILSSGN
jgi:hypothetical protein